MNDAIRKAIERCPKRESGSVENLAEEIEELEESMEINSVSAQEEKEVEAASVSLSV